MQPLPSPLHCQACGAFDSSPVRLAAPPHESTLQPGRQCAAASAAVSVAAAKRRWFRRACWRPVGSASFLSPSHLWLQANTLCNAQTEQHQSTGGRWRRSRGSASSTLPLPWPSVSVAASSSSSTPSEGLLKVDGYASQGSLQVRQTYLPDASDPASILADAEDERKLRCAVESVLRDQEELRVSTRLTTGMTFSAASFGVGLVVLGFIASTSPVWCAPVVPVLTSSMFFLASVGESSGTRSKGVARYNTAACVECAATQEGILAKADARKSFLPFGVGLTTIFATVLLALREYRDEVDAMGAAASLDMGLNVAQVACAVASVWVGAVLTTNESLRMQTALGLDIERAVNETQQQSDEPALWVQIFSCTTAAALTLLPVPFYFYIANVTDWQESINELCVIVSATAAAVSALTFFLAEKDFADAERGISTQSEQAALAELFLAQCEADVAMLPLRSSGASAALGGASLMVEFSRVAAALFPLPALTSAVGSLVSSRLSKVEADATWLERRRITGKEKGPSIDPAGVSTIRELQRIRDDVLRSDGFGDEVKKTLLKLPLGETSDFVAIPSEQRRKVHQIAAELGMPSQSRRVKGQRAVTVINSNGAQVQSEWVGQKEFAAGVGEIVAAVRSEVTSTLRSGVPKGNALAYGGVLAAGGIWLPITGVSGLTLQLATAAVGLLTVDQERVGRKEVAEAKGCSADLLSSFASAESRLGLATAEVAAIPSYLAFSTLVATSTVASCILMRASPLIRIWTSSVPSLLCLFTLVLCRERQKRALVQIELGIAQARGSPLPKDPMAWLLRNPWSWLAAAAACVVLPARATPLVCSALTATTAWVQGTATAQLAACQFFVARGLRNFALADCWAQEASICSRALPAGSALALLVALFSTAPVGVAASVFPLLNFLVLARAMQLQEAAARDADVAREVTMAQTTKCGELQPPWVRWTTTRMPLPFLQESQVPLNKPPQGAKRRAMRQLRRTLPIAFARLRRAMLRPFEAAGPEYYYAATPAERAVKSVQSDMDELRVSVRTSEKSLARTGLVVASAAVVTLLAPVLIPAVPVATALPLAGAGLTLFGVAAESEARRSVAASKAWAACLGDSRGIMEESVSVALLYKSRLLSVTGITSMVVIAAVGLETIKASSPLGQLCVAALQTLLLGVQLVASFWCCRPLVASARWADAVSRAMLQPIGAQDAGLRTPLPQPYLLGEVFEPQAHRSEMVLPLRLLTTLPPLMLAIFPFHRSFSKRVIASTAAGAFVVSIALFFTERVIARSERAMCARMRTFALADAFANEAETQGALLPLTSAAVIAISALIAVVTEVNPGVAAALTMPQALVWLIASRKALAAKGESATALQVNAVVPDDVSRNLWAERGGFGWKWKRWLLGSGFGALNRG